MASKGAAGTPPDAPTSAEAPAAAGSSATTAAAPTASAPSAAAPAAADRETGGGRTFFTAIDAETLPSKRAKESKKNKFATLESTNAGPRITEFHQELVTLANSLDQRMAVLLREHEKDFFLAYKTHMYTVQKEIKTLKLKADHEEAKTREDTKIKNLEGELDWFMTEALRLDELCKGYKKEVDKWKAKAEALDEDRRFLEDQIKGAKRQNKILRAAAERARSSAYSALMTTKARAESVDAGYPGGGGDSTLPPAPGAEPAQRPSSGGAGGADRPAAGSAARRVMEARSRTPDARTGLGVASQERGMSIKSRSGSASAVIPFNPSASRGGFGSHSLLGNGAEERYVDAIRHLKESIAKEQQNVRMLQAARASSYSQKSELEEFFLKCVDEARKDLTRRRHLTLNKPKSEQEKVYEAMLSNEDVLVCLYERLFPHRTGIARSLGAQVGAEPQESSLLAQF
mmetsp:Transcript_24754/g.53828  ORF Transcript_24754/g.53828 Transcript_24754/m.53828 type:complete len:459 (-) Transcript_24754:49-1425(-)|eukprot:CAMPEP_0206435494 /NCGR_PEP_ID=MMETSP0324_2-20121206/9900_1 /ASSEMBLY_ACC=CAM_ASM_000836 /TAXON_ID=2866 /ORGANISM="Crypthecodinium cohnii, Strain Seligo" /LENGTH=458 /DNA_ID=CAMNT_0053902437 /DNA_START=192 /DNA_END=1568 /DNA_ORIENTATION=-